jgi:hypothetical protein
MENYKCYYCLNGFEDFKNSFEHLIEYHSSEIFKIRRLILCGINDIQGYTTVNYNFRPIDQILAGKQIVCEEPDKVFIKDAENFEAPSPQIINRHKSYFSAFKTVLQYPSDEDVTQKLHDLSIQGLEPLTEEKAANTDYIAVTDVSDDLEELPGFDINLLTILSIRASAILILFARNCKLLAQILKCHIHLYACSAELCNLQ